MSKTIPLTQGKEAIVDDEMFDYLSQWKWFAEKSEGRFYACRRSRYHTIKMHRVILGCKDKSEEGDHINGNGLDNRRENLRKVTRLQNSWNKSKHKDGLCKYKGVTRSTARCILPWYAQIMVQGKNIYLGTFATQEEAARAYDAASLKYHGEFGRRNFND